MSRWAKVICGFCFGASAFGASLWGGRLVYAKVHQDEHRSSVVVDCPVLTRDAFIARATLYGVPSNDPYYVMSEYISCYDRERRVPRWVLEYLTKDNVTTKNASRDASKFYADGAIPEAFRANPNDYSASGHKRGMSRGHLAAAQFHRSSQKAMDDTFNLSLNTVPQDMTCNACDWYRLESMCKKLLLKEYAHLWVVSGPLFVSHRGRKGTTKVSYELMSAETRLAIPTHLFKVVLAEKADGTKAMASFVLPNTPLADDRPLTAFLVPRSTVERLSGLHFFPVLFPKPAADDAMSVLVNNLCKLSKCEGTTGPFSTAWRRAGRMRSARTLAELDAVWTECQRDADAAQDAMLKAEYGKCRVELLDTAKKLQQSR